MPKNLELKASVPTLRSALATCRRLRARRIGVLNQVDTYFNVNNARLKLRAINGNKFELIYYRRGDVKGSRYSDYVVVALREPTSMKNVCSEIFGVKTVVKKKRTLFLYKNARIHVDTVSGLGSFIEFEVLVDQGKRQARSLMNFLVLEFGITKQLIVGGSYADLMRKR